MIPADHIAFDGDVAWWVVRSMLGAPLVNFPDGWCDARDALVGPCDDWGGGDWWIGCDNCDGTGRHTFEIEVEQYAWGEEYTNEPVICGTTTRTLRVHVVEVLPIVGDDDDWKAPCIEIASEGNPPGLFTEDGYYVCNVPLPPVAEPGMWAVKLAVHS